MKNSKSKILITGGCGYVGQNLIKFFSKKKYQIFVIDDLSRSSSLNTKLKKKITFNKFDLKNSKKVKNYFKNKNFDVIIHLAAYSGVEEFKKKTKLKIKNNVLSTKNIINFGLNNEKTKFIFASSAAVYGASGNKKVKESKKCRPLNNYGISKYKCEKLIIKKLKSKNICFAILRYFNIVGSVLNFDINKRTSSVFDIISKKIKDRNYKFNINGKYLFTSDGTPERDYIHILDICRIHDKVISYLDSKKNIIINCGTGKKYSVLKIINNFQQKTNNSFKISFNVTNKKEASSICANTNILKIKLGYKIKQNKLKSLIQDYI